MNKKQITLDYIELDSREELSGEDLELFENAENLLPLSFFSEQLKR